jgi:hypothetical protein
MKRLFLAQILFNSLFADIGSAVLPSQKMERQSDEQVRQRARIAEQRAQAAEQRVQAAEHNLEAERTAVRNLVRRNAELTAELQMTKDQLEVEKARADQASNALFAEKETQINALMNLLPSRENFPRYFYRTHTLEGDEEYHFLTYDSMKALLWGKDILRLEFNLFNHEELRSLEEKLPEILNIVKEMKFLRGLVIRSSSLTQLPAGFFDKLSRLREVVIDANLTQIGDDIRHAVSLEVLNLGDNRLTSVSPYLFTMPKITCINLEKNLITSLPNTVISFLDRNIYKDSDSDAAVYLQISKNPLAATTDEHVKMGIDDIMAYYRKNRGSGLIWGPPQPPVVRADDNDDDDLAVTVSQDVKRRRTGDEG